MTTGRPEWMDDAARAMAGALTTPALAARLRTAAREPRSYSAAERAALMVEAADRLAGMEA